MSIHNGSRMMKAWTFSCIVAFLFVSYYACAQPVEDPVFGRPMFTITDEMLEQVKPEGTQPGWNELIPGEWELYCAMEDLLNISVLRYLWGPDSRFIYMPVKSRTGGLWRIEVETGELVLLGAFMLEYGGYRLDSAQTTPLFITEDGNELVVRTEEIDEEYGTEVDLRYNDDDSLAGYTINNIKSVRLAINVMNGETRTYTGTDLDTLSPLGTYQIESGKTSTILYEVGSDKEWIISGQFSDHVITSDDRYLYYSDAGKWSDDYLSVFRIMLPDGDIERISPVGEKIGAFIDITPDNVWGIFEFDVGPREGLYYDEDGEEIGSWNVSSMTKLRLYNLQELYKIDFLPMIDNVESSNPLFSPDGTKLSYIRKDQGIQRSSTEMYIIDFNPENLTDFPVAVESKRPISMSIDGNFPNPFNPSTTISFSLPESGHASFTVFNLSGQKIRTLIDEPMSLGNHTIVWDGTDDTGRTVAGGIYLTRLNVGGTVATGKMVLVK